MLAVNVNPMREDARRLFFSGSATMLIRDRNVCADNSIGTRSFGYSCYLRYLRLSDSGLNYAAAGAATGNLQITSNAANASVAVALTGTGTAAAAQHSVDIAWDAATPVPVGYNVYRATQAAGPFSKLNSAPVTSLVFTDSTVVAGGTYFYIVTSVAADGTESGFSNQATAVVPNP